MYINFVSMFCFGFARFWRIMLAGIERIRDGARQTGSPSDPAGNSKTWRGSCVPGDAELGPSFLSCPTQENRI